MVQLTEKQKQFIATLVSTGDNQVDYLEATQFAIESWYLGFPTAEEDSNYCEFRKYFMKKVANIESGFNRYKYDNARYSNILCDYIEKFYDEVVDEKYKNIKTFTYGFLDEYHSGKNGNEKFNQHFWECGFDEYCFEMADTITNCLIEELGREDLFNWGFWKHWDEQTDDDKFSAKPTSKRRNKK